MNERVGGATESSFGKLIEKISSAQVLLAAIAAQILPLLVWFKLSDKTTKAVAALASFALLAGAYFLWRRVRRHEAAQVARDSLGQQASARILQSGFRGLASYTRGDALPGKARQTLAKRIATNVALDTFRYGLVSGEIGAGKSSMLDSGVRSELERAGYSVVFVRGLQEFAQDRSLEAVTDAWRAQWSSVEGQPVIILDQFEELLIEWRSPEQRRKLGAFVAAPISGRNIRLLCSVRSDYIIAMHDLAPDLADPTSARTLFPIKNFDQDEAVDVILECARRDAVEIDEDLAQTIAGDLSHGGRVRPPELQLVCQSLLSGSPERRYREAGGAEGILSDYIKNAAEYSAAPELARHALRAMCNLQAMPPAKMPPQTALQISEAIGLTADDSRSARLVQVIRHLEQAGLISVVHQDDANSYALIHDYLVQPVALATADASTQSERATQLLRLHLTEYTTDPRSRIPMRRISFIRRHADRDLLASAPARSLIRRSYTRGGTVSGVAVAGVAALAVLIGYWGALTSHWARSSIAWQNPDHSPPRSLALSALNSEQEVLGYDLIGSDNSHVTLWNVGSGRLERRFPGFDAAAAADGSVVQYVDPANKHIGIARRNQRPLGTAYISAGDFDETLSFDRSGKLLLWATDVDQGSTHIRILRTSDMAIIAERDFPTGRIHDSGLNSDGTALTILRYTPAGPEPVLWKFSGAQKRDEPVVLGRGTKFITMARDEKSGKIATLGKIDDGHSLLSVWDDRTGGLRSQQRINMTDKIGMIRFVGDGRLIVVQFGQAAASILFGNSKLSNPHVFNSDDLSASQRVTQAQDGVYIWGDYLAWRDGGTTKIWDTVEDRLTSADGLPLEANARAQISPDRHRVILSRKSSTPELWDAQAWKRIKLDLPAEPVTGTTFTIDGDGVLAQLMGGHYVLLDSVNGSTIQTFSDIQDVRLAYYRRECDLVRFWTSEGLVLEFTKGRKLPFVGFRPTKRCAMRH